MKVWSKAIGLVPNEQRNRALPQEDLEKLTREVLKLLPDGSNFAIEVSPNIPTTIDWTRVRSGPPHPSAEASFLSYKVRGLELYGGGNEGPKSNEKLLGAETVVNWIAKLGTELPPVIPEAERDEQNMMEVDDTWRPRNAEYVYKYCGWEVARDYVLSGQKTIRLSDIGTMNDPLEFSRLNIGLYGGVRDDSFPLRYWNAIHRATKDGVRFFCCTQDVQTDFNHLNGFLTKRSVRGFDHPAMWNHYAKQHEGVCLIFKRSELDAAIKAELEQHGEILSGAVSYHSSESAFGLYKSLFPILSGMETWTEDELFDHAKRRSVEVKDQVYFSKNAEWCNETEFRWVFIGLGDGPIDVPIGGSLAGVIAGCDFNNEHHNELNRLSADNGIPVRRLWWKNGFANTPWDLEAFEKGDTLAQLGQVAAARRDSRR